MKVYIMLALIVYFAFSLVNSPSAFFRKNTSQSKTALSDAMTPNNDCVQTNPNQTVVYQNKTYILLKPAAAIIAGEVKWHFTKTDPGTISVQGEQHLAYTPTFYLDPATHQMIPSSVTWTPPDGLQNLLFIDVTKEQKNPVQGFFYFDVYLQNGQPVPPYITNYCKNGFSVNPLQILPNADGTSIPPQSFNTNSIKWYHIVTVNGVIYNPPANTNYYLFTYEQEGAPAWAISTDQGDWENGTLMVKSGSVTKSYRAVYMHSSAIKTIVLIDNDPNSPDHHIAYKYVTSNFVDYTTPHIQPQSSQGLQIQTFSFPTVNAWAWYSPECKPAIYLYPKTETQISVHITPKGFLTYTNPLYPRNGWQVTAYPNGSISKNGKLYPYLYYEAKIQDSAIQKPINGYVVSFNDLPNLYSTLLPKLGLNHKEQQDFTTYWEKALHKAPYYLVSVMDNSAINNIEPLAISPTPDTLIRVRLYFEALDKPIKVTTPILTAVSKRQGFTAVEWGGLVKNDKNHPFTCSQ